MAAAGVLAMFLAIGAVLGWVSVFKMNSLRLEMESLRKELGQLRKVLTVGDNETGREVAEPIAATAPQPLTDLPLSDDELSPATMSSKVGNWINSLDPTRSGMPASRATANTIAGTPARQSNPWFDKVAAHLKEQWMAWLGGLCIGLSGIFLVRYSIEQGYLGPAARISLALVTGVVLHILAEWLRRRNKQNYQAFAALAGGASITLYAALLAAVHLYQLLSPVLVFSLLAIVSLFTMALAVIHGPLLAIMGILGAYIVPILVDTGSRSVIGVLIYALIISAAAMALLHVVYRSWLWAGMLAGALAWWAMSLPSFEANGIRGFYLAALSYLLLAAPLKDWLLNQLEVVDRQAESESVTLQNLGDRVAQRLGTLKAASTVAGAPILLSMLLVLIAFGVSILAEYTSEGAIVQWTPLLFVVFLGSRLRHTLRWLPWLSLGIQATVWFSLGLSRSMDSGVLELVGMRGADQNNFLSYAGIMAVLYFVLSAWNLRTGQNRAIWISLALLAPLLWLALCYLLVGGVMQSLNWGALAMVIGLVYFSFAYWQLRRTAQNQDRDAAVWLILAGHFAYSLAVAIVFKEAGLTLSLAAQLLSLAFVISHFELPKLSVLLKLVLAVVVARLTLNPWLLSYSTEVHWSLWTYGGSTIFSALAAWRLRQQLDLRRWLEMACLHLLVLTLWAETRYWLYDGNVFSPQVDFLEMAITTALWSALGLVYYLRSTVSQSLQPVYVWASRILLLMATGSYLLILIPLNPLVNFDSGGVSARPVFNLLLLAYGLPAVMGLLLFRYYEAAFRKHAAVFACAAGFIFINLEIRHLWQGGLDIDDVMGNGELYTYSIVWLVLAIVTLLAGSIRLGPWVYRAGLGLLVLVIAKIFLVDMADLEGLLRVASFMGLGLSLLGLAYLYQRYNLSSSKAMRKPS